jgi:flagellin
MSSILTNTSAMVALQTLKTINSGLGKTQSEIATGKTIATAKDNSAIWAVSKVMEADVAGFKQISDQLALGESTVAVGLAASDQITKVLTSIKELVVAATSETADHAKIGTDITALTAQFDSIVAAAQFNGVNLLVADVDGNGASSLTVLSSLDRSGGSVTAATISVATVDFENNIDLSDIDVSDASAANASLANIETHLQTAINGAAALGSASRRLEDQGTFVSKLTDAMKSGIGTLVDADMEEASARLQALQVQQQLGIQSLSIANQAPQNILALFR